MKSVDENIDVFNSSGSALFKGVFSQMGRESGDEITMHPTQVPLGLLKGFEVA